MPIVIKFEKIITDSCELDGFKDCGIVSSVAWGVHRIIEGGAGTSRKCNPGQLGEIVIVRETNFASNLYLQAAWAAKESLGTVTISYLDSAGDGKWRVASKDELKEVFVSSYQFSAHGDQLVEQITLNCISVGKQVDEFQEGKVKSGSMRSVSVNSGVAGKA